MTLKFTDDERRAFSNALDRADIEAEQSAESWQDEQEREAAANNRRDVDRARGMWGRIDRELPELLQAAELVVLQWEGGDLAAAVRLLATALDDPRLVEEVRGAGA